MRDQLRLVAWLLMVVGGLILVVSALADPLALGMPGSSFGLKQLAGCVLGALIAFGGWRFHRRLDRADTRDRQRAQQRAQQQRQAAGAAAAGARSGQPTPATAAPVMTQPTPPVGSLRDDDAAAPPAPQIRTNLAETRAMADTTELPRLPQAQHAPVWDDDDTDDDTGGGRGSGRR